MRLARDALAWAMLGIAGRAEAQESIGSRLIITPPQSMDSATAVPPEGLPLQLEVFLNDRPRNLISAFTLRSDGSITSPVSELEEIGLAVPEILRARREVPLSDLPEVRHIYDEASQSIRFFAGSRAMKPLVIDGHVTDPVPTPARPPFGAIINYSVYASGEDARSGFTFDGVSAELDMRLFGSFGLFENGVLVRRSSRDVDTIRLNSTYAYEDPASLRTLEVGDFISGGFSWTRSVRLGGIQLRRNFGLQPDLIIVPLPTFTGSAATPSTLDLFVNSVRAFSSELPQGPFEITHPPIIYGGGVARIHIRDALGRETISSSAFYTSPTLLAPGLSDFSASLGFARRDYATKSNAYDGKLAATASWRKGISDGITVQAHGETVGSLALLGGGGIFKVGNIGVASLAVAGSRSAAGRGGLVNAAFESRMPGFTLMLRTQRIFGDYEDMASWTEELPPHSGGQNRVFGGAREIDQVTVSLPGFWKGSALGGSFIQTRGGASDKARILNLSYNQELGRLSLFASGFTDFERSGSTGLFFGLALPLGHNVSASTGLSHRRGGTSAFVEASRHGHHQSGELGWTVRASGGERQEGEAIARYSTSFARAEAGLLYLDGAIGAHALVEGAISIVGGAVHASQRVDDSFALVEVGAPNVTVLHENRPTATTNGRGQALIPHLTPYVGNRISIDATNLPIDSEVMAEAIVAPFARVPVRVDLRSHVLGETALVGFVDPSGTPLPLGSEVMIEGQPELYAIGYDGAAYLRGLTRQNRVRVTSPEGKQCQAEFSYAPVQGQQVQINGVACRPAA